MASHTCAQDSKGGRVAASPWLSIAVVEVWLHLTLVASAVVESSHYRTWTLMASAVVEVWLTTVLDVRGLNCGKGLAHHRPWALVASLH